MLDEIDPSPGVRLLGVSGSNLGPVMHQLSLDHLAAESSEPGARSAAIDEIRARFGVDAIGPASSVRGGRVRTVKRGGQPRGPDAPSR